MYGSLPARREIVQVCRRLYDRGLIAGPDGNVSVRLPGDRVLTDNIAANGHVYCADMFINYQTARERGLLRPGEKYLAAAEKILESLR